MIESSKNTIEDEIKPLCEAINSYDGLKTHFSCSGHPEENDYKGYVSFTSENPDSLLNLAKKIPNAKSIRWNEDGVEYFISLYLETHVLQGELAHSIRFEGHPACVLNLIWKQLPKILIGKRDSFNLNKLN